MDTLNELLEFEGKEIDHLFGKASIEGRGTPQEVSDRREEALTNFLKKYFPFPYRIAKGNIRDSYAKSSMSIDCILLNPSHPYTTGNDSQYSIILADGVDIAIELKPSLNTPIEIERALTQIESVKKLSRVRSGIFNLTGEGNQEYEDNCKKIPCVIFANKTYSDKKLLIEKIVNFYENKGIKREFQFDIIVINQDCLIYNYRKNSYIDNGSNPDGIYIVKYGAQTTAAFLKRLNQFPQSQVSMSSSVLEHYIKTDIIDVVKYNDLNKRLLSI